MAEGHQYTGTACPVHNLKMYPYQESAADSALERVVVALAGLELVANIQEAVAVEDMFLVGDQRAVVGVKDTFLVRLQKVAVVAEP